MPPEAPILLTGRLFPEGAPSRVRIENGRISAIDSIRSLDEAPGEQRWIVPGFFDLQVNGFAGRNFSNPDLSAQDVEHICWSVLRTGVMFFLPTVVTADLDVMCRQLATISKAMKDIPIVGSMCPGIHVEGPFINPEDGPRGAHRREFVRPPSIADFERLYAATDGWLSMLTLAPDQPGAIELISYITWRTEGVVVALGHHRADAETLDRASQAGAKISTHLGNAADAMLPRMKGNYIWDQLGDDRLWASFIADGHHLPPFVLRSMLRAKTPERSILVTDTTELAGVPPGRYTRRGVEVELTADGKVVLSGTPYLAGSAATMPQLIATTATEGGLSFVEAVRLATMQPERLVFDHVPMWTQLPGDLAHLVELTWKSTEARIEILRVVSGVFPCSAVGDKALDG